MSDLNDLNKPDLTTAYAGGDVPDTILGHIKRLWSGDYTGMANLVTGMRRWVVSSGNVQLKQRNSSGGEDVLFDSANKADATAMATALGLKADANTVLRKDLTTAQTLNSDLSFAAGKSPIWGSGARWDGEANSFAALPQVSGSYWVGNSGSGVADSPVPSQTSAGWHVIRSATGFGYGLEIATYAGLSEVYFRNGAWGGAWKSLGYGLGIGQTWQDKTSARDTIDVEYANTTGAPIEVMFTLNQYDHLGFFACPNDGTTFLKNGGTLMTLSQGLRNGTSTRWHASITIPNGWRYKIAYPGWMASPVYTSSWYDTGVGLLWKELRAV